MTEGGTARLVAWASEMQRVHDRLREALHVTREAAAAGADAAEVSRDLLLFCHGFCTALQGHHEGEDARLFPVVEAAHPELAPALRRLEQDHAMIGTLLADLQRALAHARDPAALDRHLEGLAAIMESHFRYEERQLLGVLATLDLDATPQEAFGPL